MEFYSAICAPVDSNTSPTSSCTTFIECFHFVFILSFTVCFLVQKADRVSIVIIEKFEYSSPASFDISDTVQSLNEDLRNSSLIEEGEYEIGSYKEGPDPFICLMFSRDLKMSSADILCRVGPFHDLNVSLSTTGELTGPLTDLWVRRHLLQTVVK